MTEIKKPGFPVGGTPAKPLPETVPVKKLSGDLKRLLEALPERHWNQIRAFHVESDEEGQILATVPLMHRAMKICPSQVIRRLKLKEITAQELDEAYGKLHDAIHGLRQALHELFNLAVAAQGRPGNPNDPARSVTARPPMAGGKVGGAVPAPPQGKPPKAVPGAPAGTPAG